MGVWCCWVAGVVYPPVFLLVGFPECGPPLPSSCPCLYFLNFCFFMLLEISKGCFVIDRALLCECVWDCVCVLRRHMCVWQWPGELMAILTKPYVIRAWLSPHVSLLNWQIALLYGLLIAWVPISPSGPLEFCEYGFFCIHTLTWSSVCTYECVSRFFVCVCTFVWACMLCVCVCVTVCIVCHAGWLQISPERSPAN